MSRQISAIEDVRAGRRIIEMKQKGNNRGPSRGSSKTASPSHQSLSRSGRRGLSSHTPITIQDDGEDEDGDVDESNLLSGRSGGAASKASAASSGKRAGLQAGGSIRKRPERKKQERKASVRKESYQISDSESDLTDAPEDDDDDADTESDGEMAKRLQAAGDGESLLGSATSDREEERTDEEEERFIIEDTARKEAKAAGRRSSRRDSMGAAMRGRGGQSAEDGYDDEYADDGSGSLSPQTLQQLGLDGFEDELFEPQEAFHSSSEPSFTDFFGSGTDDETDNGLTIALEPRHDDNELTTDDEDEDVTDISDLDEGMLSAPFLAREALAAGAFSQVTTGPDAAVGPADVPLLVIEDLDGRLIYARAGDGEAVFGSDGEFEFVDDSDEEDTDEDMDGLGFDDRDHQDWSAWAGDGPIGPGGRDSDDGDTTDELPDEDMPFPRLLIGSVAPNGGRNARRARAMAARSRRESPSGVNGRSRERGGRASKGSKEQPVVGPVPQSAPSTPGEGVQELDFCISTEALARDPKGTLEAAAKSLGLTADEVARLVAGIQKESEPGKEGNGEREGEHGDSSASPQLPRTPSSKPQMGSFMPTSFKSIHRAVIDGNRQAPSPFSNRHGMQKRGLANRKRDPSTTTPSAKRLRRFSSADVASQQEGTGGETSEAGTKSSSRNASPIDPMELDDVVDASMLWRSSYSTSPPAAGQEEDQTTPVMRATKASPSVSSTALAPTSAGLNLNAFARWHRIPMGAFRDGQGAAGSSSQSGMSQQPLGSFLLTRSSRAQSSMNQTQTRRKQKAIHLDQSPFRGRGEGDSIHMGAVPHAQRQSDGFVVSPILWPVRHGAPDSHSNAAIWYTPNAMEPINREGNARQCSSRKVMTKREKRQRKARKAAVRAALRASTEGGDEGLEDQSTRTWSRSPAPKSTVRNLGPDSPASALPRLSITDASPRASPLPTGKAQPMSGPPHSPSTAMDMYPSSASTPTHGPTVATNTSSHNILSTSPSSQSTGSQHQLPSSVFGVPLHSPLFSGIFNPTNLGFRDDLEERDEEGVLTI